MKLINNAAFILLFTPLLAFAGKAERDFIASDVDPAVKTAAATLKKSCGCDVKFDIKIDSFKDKDELFKIKHFATMITENSAPYCSDAASKAAVCKLKTIEFSKGSTDFKFAGGKGTATTDGTSTPSWDMITRVIDK